MTAMLVSNYPSDSASKVLVVDDVADNRDLLQILLESEGYEVETAPEGYTAIAKIETSPPDLVLLDLMMPDMNGYEVAKWVAQNYPGLPILIVTGHSESPDFSKIKSIVDCIRKPFSLEEVIEKIQAFVSFSQNRKRYNALNSCAQLDLSYQ